SAGRRRGAALPDGAGRRPADGNGATGRRRRPGPLPQRPAPGRLVGTGAARTFFGPASTAGKDHQARGWLRAHAADPRWAIGPALGTDATTRRPRPGRAAGVGTRPAAAPGPQQGRGRGRQQARAAPVGHRPPRHRLRPAARQPQALKQFSSPGVHDDRVMTKGSVPGLGKADNNSGSRSRLNDRPPPADFMMARAQRAHPKAEYTTATVPLPTTKRSISVLLKRGVHTRIVRPHFVKALVTTRPLRKSM